MPPRAEGASCAKCAHYFITFDARFPYGCRAMGFKSLRLPAQEIFAVTGTACVTFAPKTSSRREDV